MDFYQEESPIDLRTEFSALLRGRIDLVGQGRPVIRRQLIDAQPCICWNQTTGSPREDCVYCQGEGFSFYESHELFYIALGVAPIYKPGFLATGQYPQASYGYTDPNRATGFCEYSVYPNYEVYVDGTKKEPDKIYELKVGTDGGIYYPETRTTKWRVLTITPLHGDRGRVEMIELALEEEEF